MLLSFLTGVWTLEDLSPHKTNRPTFILAIYYKFCTKDLVYHLVHVNLAVHVEMLVQMYVCTGTRKFYFLIQPLPYEN